MYTNRCAQVNVIALFSIVISHFFSKILFLLFRLSVDFLFEGMEFIFSWNIYIICITLRNINLVGSVHCEVCNFCPEGF